KTRLNSGNACYHSVQNLLSSCLLSKNKELEYTKTIILPVALHRCETWSLTLREEYRLRVFENRMLRRLFGPTRDEVTEGWRKLHNEELHNLCSSLSIILFPSIITMIKSRRMRWARRAARTGERNTYRNLVGKPEGNRSLRIYRRRLEDSIKVDLRELILVGMDWIDLAQDRD
ncbi:hypothetical protein B7P43_G16802, partial [Cryptotermes secundus]